MRLSFVTEAVSISKHRPQILKVIEKIGIDGEDLVQNLNNIDPSGKYTSWILKQIYYKNIIVPEDNHRIKETLSFFQENKRRLTHKDINQYRTIFDLEKEIEGLYTGSKRQNKFQVDPRSLPGVKIINSNGQYVLWAISNARSLAEMGEGTKWCTRKSYPDCYAEYYINKYGLIFIISDDNRPIIQFDYSLEDVEDISGKDVDNLYGFQELLKPLGDEVLKQRMFKALINYYKLVIQDVWPEADKLVLSFMADGTIDYEYEEWIELFIIEVKGRWEEAEPIIAHNKDIAFWYASEILKRRWPEAEKTILEHIIEGDYSYKIFDYLELAGEPIPAFERALFETYYYSNFNHIDTYKLIKYCKYIRGRWPEAEEYLMSKDGTVMVEYAMHVIKGRWLEAEPEIAKYAVSAFYYAKNVIQGRFYEAEPYILEYPAIAAMYVEKIIKSRWPEFESMYYNDAGTMRRYKKILTDLRLSKGSMF